MQTLIISPLDSYRTNRTTSVQNQRRSKMQQYVSVFTNQKGQVAPLFMSLHWLNSIFLLDHYSPSIEIADLDDTQPNTPKQRSSCVLSVGISCITLLVFGSFLLMIKIWNTRYYTLQVCKQISSQTVLLFNIYTNLNLSPIYKFSFYNYPSENSNKSAGHILTVKSILFVKCVCEMQ